MAITIKEVEGIAKLARIELGPQELEFFTGQLDKILGYINKLKELDVSGIEPSTGVLALKNVLREDEIRPSLSASEALGNTVQKEKNCFKVPKVIE